MTASSRPPPTARWSSSRPRPGSPPRTPTNATTSTATPSARATSASPASCPRRAVEGPVVSEDGERAYFISSRALAPGRERGQEQRSTSGARTAPGEVELRRPRPSGFATGGSRQNVATTPDGATLVFSSNRPELNALTGRSNGGLKQNYRYDYRSGTLDCVSCPAPPQEATCAERRHRRADRPLRVRRLQGPERGRPLLLLRHRRRPRPRGRERRRRRLRVARRPRRAGQRRPHLPAASSKLNGISADGRDVLFARTPASPPMPATPTTQLYDARVGGGFASLYQPPPDPCAGDGCRGPQEAPPADATPATPGFSGPGNAKKDQAALRQRQGEKERPLREAEPEEAQSRQAPSQRQPRRCEVRSQVHSPRNSLKALAAILACLGAPALAQRRSRLRRAGLGDQRPPRPHHLPGGRDRPVRLRRRKRRRQPLQRARSQIEIELPPGVTTRAERQPLLRRQDLVHRPAGDLTPAGTAPNPRPRAPSSPAPANPRSPAPR